MIQYLQVLGYVLTRGVRQKNRTGINTFMVPGATMMFDLADGFPILTTKAVNFKAITAELLGFIRGYTSAQHFRDLGTKIWDANANVNEQWLKNPNRKGTDHLGRIYGAQWRDWQSPDLEPGGSCGKPDIRHVDQLDRALKMIQTDPTSRRIIVSAWQPGELDQMALPPCHLLYQFLVTQADHKLHMTMYMRSCDMFLGVPFNISSYALLLSMVAAVTGYKVGTLTMFLADVHIYENHVDQVKEQMQRLTRARPTLDLTVHTDNDWPAVRCLEYVQPHDVALVGYDPHPAIKGEMAV